MRLQSYLPCSKKELIHRSALVPRLRRGPSYRLARSQAVLDVALEDDTVGLGESEGLVHADQGIALGREPGEDGRVNGAAFVVDDRESGARILKK